MKRSSGVSKCATLAVAAVATLTTGALAGPASGQAWEIAVRRVTIDHDPPSNVARSGEQIPTGLGLSARHLWQSGMFVEMEVSRGSEERTGAICGGFIVDPATQCVVETVGYSGGLVAVSTGWLSRLQIGSEWWLGVRPRAGLGAVWMHETGRDTGRSFSEAPLTLLVGLEGEVGYQLPWRPLALTAAVGVDQLRPVRISCEDCRQVLNEPLPQVRMGLGLAWRTP